MPGSIRGQPSVGREWNQRQFGPQTENNSSRMLMGKEFDLQNMGHLGSYFIFSHWKRKFLLSMFSLFGSSHINSPFCCTGQIRALQVLRRPHTIHFSVTTWCCKSCLWQLPSRPANSGGKGWTGVESQKQGVSRCDAAWHHQLHRLSKGTHLC